MEECWSASQATSFEPCSLCWIYPYPHHSLHPSLVNTPAWLLSLDAPVSTFCLFVCNNLTFPSVVNNCIKTKGGRELIFTHINACNQNKTTMQVNVAAFTFRKL